MYISSCPTELQLASSDYATMSIWWRSGSGINSGGQLMCQADGAATRWDCYFQSSHIEWRVNNGGFDTCTGVTDLLSTTNIDHWHHVVIRKNGQGANAMQLFIDGKLDGSTTSSRTFPGGSNNFCLGNRGQTDSAACGRFADYAVWDAALSNNEILSIYKGESPLRVRSGSLKGYWPLDDTEQIGGSDVSRDRGRYNNNLSVWGGSPAVPVLPSYRDSIPGDLIGHLDMLGLIPYSVVPIYQIVGSN